MSIAYEPCALRDTDGEGTVVVVIVIVAHAVVAIMDVAN